MENLCAIIRPVRNLMYKPSRMMFLLTAMLVLLPLLAALQYYWQGQVSEAATERHDDARPAHVPSLEERPQYENGLNEGPLGRRLACAPRQLRLATMPVQLAGGVGAGVVGGAAGIVTGVVEGAMSPARFTNSVRSP